jgi:hypothetical protein
MLSELGIIISLKLLALTVLLFAFAIQLADGAGTILLPDELPLLPPLAN